jgi:hypothetical protein
MFNNPCGKSSMESFYSASATGGDELIDKIKTHSESVLGTKLGPVFFIKALTISGSPGDEYLINGFSFALNDDGIFSTPFSGDLDLLAITSIIPVNTVETTIYYLR